MNTSLTVGSSRPILYTYATPADQNSSAYIGKLNQVCARLLDMGKYVGSIVERAFDGSEGFITLPFDTEAILGVQIDRCPALVFSEFHEFIQVGPGQMREELHTQGVLVDMGDGFATKKDILEANYLKFIINAPADAGKTVRIYGESGEAGSYGEDIYDSTTGVRGMSVTLTYPSVTTNFKVKKITGLEIEAGRVGLMGLYVLTSGDDRLLSKYYPFEFYPTYKRFKTQTTTKVILLKCQVRFVPMTAETDWVIPGNIGALKFGLMALNYEDTGYEESANENWNKARSLLSLEARSKNGSDIFALNFAPYGNWNGNIGNMH